MENPRYGFLLVMMQPPPAMEEEFNAWYDTEHVPERLAVPGFLSARRFVSLDGHPRYLALYDLERPEVLQSPEYLAVSGDAFSPWTKRITSRVLVDRRAGTQLYPGNAVTARAPRLMLLRFSGIAASEAGDLVATLRNAFEDRPETAGLRVLACAESGAHYAIVDARAAVPHAQILPQLDGHAAALDLVCTYAPYDPRL